MEVSETFSSLWHTRSSILANKGNKWKTLWILLLLPLERAAQATKLGYFTQCCSLCVSKAEI